MNIGIDLDNTIFDTNKVFLKYLNEFITNENIDYFDWFNDNILKTKFYKMYLKKINLEADIIDNAKEVINYFKNNDNKIYIITNRNNKYDEDCLNTIKFLLDKNGINYDDIFMVDDEKVEICKRLKIDYMIDDNKNIYEKLKQNNINVILFDKDSKYDDKLIKVSNWKQILEIILNKR